MRGDEQRDELIDAALRSYAEPPEMPNARTASLSFLERARVERPRRVRAWMGWIPATVGALAMLIAGTMWMIRGPQTPQIAWTPGAPGVASTTFTPDKPARTMPHRSSPAATHIARAEAERLPKLDVFPTPEPLSAEERALMAFATQAPAAEKKRVMEEQQHLGDPIAIAEMEIRPLDGEETRNRQ